MVKERSETVSENSKKRRRWTAQENLVAQVVAGTDYSVEPRVQVLREITIVDP